MGSVAGLPFEALALVLGFPLLLLLLLVALGRLEQRLVVPDERAAEVHALLERIDEAEEVEEAVARILASAVTARGRRRRGGGRDRRSA